MSRIYSCTDTGEIRSLGIKAAVGAVKSGRLVVLPTDTLYGLGCDAFDNDAVARLLAAKDRGPDMPVPVLVGSWDTARGLVHSYNASFAPSSRPSGPVVFQSWCRKPPR